MPPLVALVGPLLAAIGGGSALAGAGTLAGLTTAGIGLGETIGKAVGGGPKQPSPFPTAGQIGTDKAQLAGVVRQNLGNLQEQGGGGLSPNYDASIIGTSTGTGNQPNQLQDIVNQMLNGSGGGGGGTPSGGSPSPNFASLSIPSQSNSSLSGGQGLADTNSIFGGG